MRVYIAGPFVSDGNVKKNILRATDAAHDIAELGHVPMAAHWKHGWEILYPDRAEWWVWWDLQWLAVCDALYRLPGRSLWSDLEVDFAHTLGKQVFRSLGEIPRRRR